MNKIKNIIGKSWRDASTLIVLTKRNSELVSQNMNRGGVNYDVLLQTRTQSASFANSVVFPGGVREPSDGGEHWLNHFKSFGFSQQDFEALHSGCTNTILFQDNPVQRHIELRITAIRETFEELGLLICSQQHKKDRSDIWASAITDLDVNHWRERLNKNPEELLNLCKEYNCYPDIWSLHYWSNWLTPARAPKRFDTAFFVTAFENQPTGIKSNSEVANIEWLSPPEVLNNNKYLLFPPQAYELQRLSHLADIDELIKFARERSCHSDELYYIHTIKTKDGIVHVFPGDDLYPLNIDYNDPKVSKVDKTSLELREGCETLHRFESTNLKEKIFDFVTKNYKPTQHINMGDKVTQTRFGMV